MAQKKYLYAAVRYVELNPVRARLVTCSRDWPWPSARAHLQGRDDRLVQVVPMLERVSGWPSYLEHVDFLKKTDAIRKHTCTGRPLGSRAFIEVAEKLTGRVLKPA